MARSFDEMNRFPVIISYSLPGEDATSYLLHHTFPAARFGNFPCPAGFAAQRRQVLPGYRAGGKERQGHAFPAQHFFPASECIKVTAAETATEEGPAASLQELRRQDHP